MKKLFVIALNLVILGGAAWLGYQKFEEYFNNPWTRDGQVRANVIKVAPRVSGPIVNVAVQDNQEVKTGDLLFEIDPATYEVALSQADVALERAIVSSRGKKIEYDRLKDIRAKDRGAVSHKDLIRREIAYEESLLQIKSPPRIARGAYSDAGLPRLFRNTYRQARLLNYPNPYFSLSYTKHGRTVDSQARGPSDMTTNAINRPGWKRTPSTCCEGR